MEPKRLSAEAMQFLTEYGYPGNVRQLENVCHWLTVMAPAQTVDVKDLPVEIRAEPQQEGTLGWTTVLENVVNLALARGERDLMDRMTRDFESVLIRRALQHTGGRRIEAAQLLGIGRNTITRKINELGLDAKAEDIA